MLLHIIMTAPLLPCEITAEQGSTFYSMWQTVTHNCLQMSMKYLCFIPMTFNNFHPSQIYSLLFILIPWPETSIKCIFIAGYENIDLTAKIH
jgi:hypothetical protein